METTTEELLDLAMTDWSFGAEALHEGEVLLLMQAVMEEAVSGDVLPSRVGARVPGITPRKVARFLTYLTGGSLGALEMAPTTDPAQAPISLETLRRALRGEIPEDEGQIILRFLPGPRLRAALGEDWRTILGMVYEILREGDEGEDVPLGGEW